MLGKLELFLYVTYTLRSNIREGFKFEFGHIAPIVEGKFVNVPEWSEHSSLVKHSFENN